MPALRRLLPLLLLASLLAAAPAAHARAGEEVTFEAPRDFFDPAKRAATFDQLDSLGVRSLRIVLYWHDVAPQPDARIKPKLDMADPAVYDWSKYQPVLDEAQRRGWTVQVTASGPVPRWATNGARDTVTRPSPNEFRMFMTALSKHFGAQVARWAVWNEPNHPQFLAPQYDSAHRPVSPGIYRNLYAAALRGLAAAGDTRPVLMGETAPTGTGRDVAPLTFLRGALCLTEDYHRHGGCQRLRVDGYAHHAYSTRLGPYYRPASPNFVTIGVLSRLTTALDRAAKAGVIAAHLPIYLTEFGVQSTPDPLYGVSLQRQAEYRSYAEHIAYENPRVAAFSQYLLTDDEPLKNVPATQRYSGFESGLRTAAGKAKPSLDGFRLALVVRSVDGRASLWGLVRPARGSTRVVVQRHERGRPWATLSTVTTDGRGAFTLRGTLGSATREWRLRWTAPDGTTYSGAATRALK